MPDSTLTKAMLFKNMGLPLKGGDNEKKVPRNDHGCWERGGPHLKGKGDGSWPLRPGGNGGKGGYNRSWNHQ